jgi:hypothetical protein
MEESKGGAEREDESETRAGTRRRHLARIDGALDFSSLDELLSG